MSEIKIEKNVPFTEVKKGPRSIYPYKQMEVGDSFVFQGEVKNPYTSAKTAGFAYGMKFIVRKLPDGTYRCWRIE